MPVNPSVRTCTHIKATGHPCGSPALRGGRFCYFHERMIRGVPTPPKSRIHPMALIENEECIQVALMETINAIVRNTIDLKRAALILRALSIATHNARRARFGRQESEMVRVIPDYPPPAPQIPLRAVEEIKEENKAPENEVAQRQNPPAPHAAQPEVPRKPPARVTPTPAAQAQAATARPQRE
jgi:hypothetical protein